MCTQNAERQNHRDLKINFSAFHRKFFNTSKLIIDLSSDVFFRHFNELITSDMADPLISDALIRFFDPDLTSEQTGFSVSDASPLYCG